MCANTSQAKGRVERAHHTLQDRLVKELRLAGISTIEAANAFLPAFVQTHNGRFAKPPARDRDLHRPIAGRNDLDDILCWREQRSVSRQLVVNYNRMKLMPRPDKTPAAVADKLVDIYQLSERLTNLPEPGASITWAREIKNINKTLLTPTILDAIVQKVNDNEITNSKEIRKLRLVLRESAGTLKIASIALIVLGVVGLYSGGVEH